MSSREKREETIPGNAVHQELNDELRELASLHSLGLLGEAEAGGWESHLQKCSVCAAEVRACRELVAVVSLTEAERVMATLPESQPPETVKEKLMQQIASLSHQSLSQQSLPAAGLSSYIVRLAEGQWQEVLPGVEVKRLFVDPVTKMITSLVRVAAGAVYPAHMHTGVEHFLVLEGEVVFDDHTLSSGDYELRAPDSLHSSATTAPGEGCLVLVINNGNDKFLA